MPEAVLDAPPPSAAPKAAPAAAPPGHINVSTLPTALPKEPPKPGSARDRMWNEVEKIAKPPYGQAAPPAEPESPQEAPQEIPEPSKVEKPPAEPAPDPKAEKVKPADEKKLSPWKLVERYKGELLKAQNELLEIKSKSVPESERQSLTERMESINKRNQELEDEIRYVNYAKSQEYQDKHWKPYEAEWTRAMKDTQGIGITLENGQVRAFTADDMLAVVNAPPASAARVAKELVADPDVATFIAARAEKIRDLFAAQSQALEDAKKQGGEREAKRKQDMQAMFGTVSRQVKETWDKVNESVMQDPKLGEFFKPREGDEEWNQSLEKGFEMVKQAYSENAMDPRLTPEQRLSVIKRHAAVRNMAAGWAPLRKENIKLKAKVSSLENDLKQYRQSAPAAGGTAAGPSVPATLRGRDALRADLQKLAK